MTGLELRPLRREEVGWVYRWEMKETFPRAERRSLGHIRAMMDRGVYDGGGIFRSEETDLHCAVVHYCLDLNWHGEVVSETEIYCSPRTGRVHSGGNIAYSEGMVPSVRDRHSGIESRVKEGG